MLLGEANSELRPVQKKMEKAQKKWRKHSTRNHCCNATNVEYQQVKRFAAFRPINWTVNPERPCNPLIFRHFFALHAASVGIAFFVVLKTSILSRTYQALMTTPTLHLPFPKALSLFQAAEYSLSNGWPLTHHIVVAWGYCGLQSQPEIFQAHKHFLERLRHWFDYQNIPFAHVWTMENAKDRAGLHSHIVIHCPRDRSIALESYARATINKIHNPAELDRAIKVRRPTFKNANDANVQLGLLRYVCKTIEFATIPYPVTGESILAHDYLGITPETDPAKLQPITVQRCGTSRSIAPKARQAYQDHPRQHAACPRWLPTETSGTFSRFTVPLPQTQETPKQHHI